MVESVTYTDSPYFVPRLVLTTWARTVAVTALFNSALGMVRPVRSLLLAAISWQLYSPLFLRTLPYTAAIPMCWLASVATNRSTFSSLASTGITVLW